MEFEVPGNALVVRGRLEGQLLPVRSLWFTSAREIRGWAASTAPLYVRWTGARSAVVGPRLDSIRASSFSPVWRLRLVEADRDRTRVVLRSGYPGVTALLVTSWIVLLAVWGYTLVILTPVAEQEPALLLGWATLALGAVAAPVVGAAYGRAALHGARDWLEQQARSEPVEGEDW